jgi:hypothetical protein
MPTYPEHAAFVEIVGSLTGAVAEQPRIGCPFIPLVAVRVQIRALIPQTEALAVVRAAAIGADNHIIVIGKCLAALLTQLACIF